MNIERTTADECAPSEFHSDELSPWRFQFTLRTLMIFTAVVALGCGMWKWKGPWGLYLFAMGSGFALVVAGVWLRRLALVVLGILMMVGVEAGLRFSLRRTWIASGSGWTTISVPFQVVDAETGKAVVGAAVRLRSLSSGDEPEGGRRARTNADGTRRVPATNVEGETEADVRLLFISEEYVFFVERLGSRWVTFDGVVATIEAEGYRPATIQLEERFPGRYDIRKDSLPPVRVELRRE